MSTPNQPKPKRSWYQFRLRTILIVFTVLSIPLGWIGWKLEQGRKQRATVAWVEEMGGRVDFAFAPKNWWQKRTDRWLGERVDEVSYLNTQVIDLSPLAELKNLQRLNLCNTQVSNLSPLAGLKSLDWLDLAGTPVSDLSPLAELTSLKTIILRTSQVSDLSPLAELKNLEMLWLDNMPVSDLSPLAELENLETLRLNNTQVSDLSPIAKLKNLESLSLDNTQVSAEQVRQLQQALPNCKIRH